MTQKTNKKMLIGLPILTAIIVGSLGISNVFADESTDRRYLPGDTISFQGKTEGWAVFNGEAHPANIIFDGNATLNQNDRWKLVTTAQIDYSSGTGEVTLKGKASDGQISLTGDGISNDGISFKLILRGNYAPIHEQEDQFALDWKFATIHVPKSGINILLLQDGIIEIMQN